MIRPSARLLWLVALLGGGCGLWAAFVPGQAWFAVLVLGMAGLAAALDAIAALRAPSPLRARLHEGGRQTKDRAGRVVIEVSGNVTRASLLRAALPLPPTVETPREILDTWARPGAWRVLLTWEVVARKRGRYAIPAIYLTDASRLGLWETRRAVPLGAELRVYPNLLHERRRLAAMFMNRGLAGVHAQRRVGKGRDFEQLREYIPGDSYEDIHWKATARRRRPVTNIYQVERTQEVYVLVDVSRLSGRAVRTEDGGQELQLERFIGGALVLALVTQKQGDLFGLVTFSDRVHGFVRARAGRQHFGACRDALYLLEPRPVNPDYEELFSFVRLRLRKRALLVVLTNLDDPALAEAFARHARTLASHHLMLVHMISPRGAVPVFHGEAPGTLEGVYRRLAGHLQWHALRELQRELHRLGATMTLTDSAALTPELVSQYVNVKQRQAL